MNFFERPNPSTAALRAVALAALCLGVVPAAQAQVSAAKVMAVTGTAKAIDAQGQERVLEKGAEVKSGDKIVTAEGALVQIRLNDGGYMSIRSGTEMVIDRFAYDDKDPANSNFLVSLVRGGFRSITGLIGRTNPAAYQIRTTTATLGIRGTDHEPMVIPQGPSPFSALGAPGIYDKVNDGETFIRNQGGLLALKRGDVGFAGMLPERPPQILQKVPDFYKVELKTDARDPKEGNADSGEKKTLAPGTLLRPSLAARREVLKPLDTTVAAPTVTDPTTLRTTTVISTVPLVTEPAVAPTTTVLPTTTLVREPVLATTTITPVLTVPTTTLIAPVTTLTPIAPVVAPTTTTTINTTVLPRTTINTTILPR